MKKIILGMMTVAVIGIGYKIVNPENTYAQSGCCKIREATDVSWIPSTESYEQCLDDNQEEDDDDLFKPKGKFWWDLSC